MKYNVDFDILSALFLIVYYVFLKVQYNSDSKSNVSFRILVMCVIFADILDTVTAFTISYSNSVPVSLNYALNVAYFLVAASSTIMLPVYIRYLLDPEGAMQLYDWVGTVIITVYGLIVVTDPITHWMFYFDENRNYTAGPIYLLGFIIPIYYMSTSLIRIIIRRKEFTTKQYYGTIAFILIAEVGPTVQLIWFRDVLLSFSAIALALIVLLFTYETPDYQKLVATTKELEESKEQLEKAKNTAEEATRTVHEIMKTASWSIWLDEKGEITDVDSSAEFRYLLNGNTDMDIPDYQLWYESLHPDDRDRVTLAIDRASKGLDTYNEEFRLNDKTGTYRWYKGTGELFKTPGGAAHFHGIIQDIHEEKLKEKLQEEKLTALEDLERSQAALKAALEEAQQANRAKSDFLSNMSHDIRTPMNAVIGFTELAMENSDDPAAVKGYLEKIQTSGNHLLMLINDVLDMSKIESGRINIEPEKCDLIELVHDLEKIEESEIKTRGLHYNMNLENLDESIVMCDRLRLNQILLNCLGNSIKFTPDGGYVELRLQKIGYTDPDHADFAFIIADTGIGMSKEFLEHIFEPFERERTSTISKTQGTGLGMTITKRLVEMMGGTIDVESREGEGTTYTINLNFEVLHEHSTLADREEDINEVSLETMVEFLRGRHFLLVDDNATNRMLARGVFKARGMTADEAVNGEEAVEKVANSAFGEYDMILMDVQMPVMDGLTATDRIRAMEDPELAELPILAMTANAFAEDRDECMAHGMNDYIAKPYKPDELIRKLYACLKN